MRIEDIVRGLTADLDIATAEATKQEADKKKAQDEAEFWKVTALILGAAAIVEAVFLVIK